MSTMAVYPNRLQQRGLLLILLLTALVIVAALWGLSVGAVAIPVDVIINTLFNLDGEQQTYIIMKSRLPRMVLALLSGGALALSGAIMTGAAVLIFIRSASMRALRA